MLDADGLGHRVRLLPIGDAVLVEPDVFGRLALLEEQEIRADAGVGFEDAVGQADDGVEVALLHQVFLEPRLDAFAEQRAVRQHHGGAATGLSRRMMRARKRSAVSRGLEVFGEVAFDAVLFLRRRTADW